MSGSSDADQVLLQLVAILEASDDAVITTTLEGEILTWNQGAERLFSYGSDEVIGRQISIIVPTAGEEEMAEVLAQAARGEPGSHRRVVRATKSGSGIQVDETISALRDRSRAVTRAVIISRRPVEHSQQTSPSLRFFADAAHQLRSPITGIQASAEALLLGPPDDERDRLLASLVRETARAGRVLGALLRLARLDEGEPLMPSPCDLLALCADEADRTWALAPHLDIVLRADPLSDPQPELDVVAVRDILANLLDNARRHAVGRIEVLVQADGSHIEIRVADDGPGLPEGMVERAFERFVTLDGRGGAGLGLAIARRLARAHGGDVRYEEGSFLVRLPAVNELDEASEVAS